MNLKSFNQINYYQIKGGIIIDILLYNSKDEVVTAYTSNNPDYQNGEEITIKGSSKNYKVVDINKYRVMGREQHIVLELKTIK